MAATHSKVLGHYSVCAWELTPHSETFADDQLTDAIKHLASDSGTDPKVRRKLIGVLASWNREFQGNPSMALVANLYKSVPHSVSTSHAKVAYTGVIEQETDYEKRRREEREQKEETKRKAKEAKAEEKRKKEEEMRQKTVRDKRKRTPFNFEQERPQILQAIAETSQAATNLVNAITVCITSMSYPHIHYIASYDISS